MKINWSGPLTKGRQVYATTLGFGKFRGVNYDTGFLIGWDKWSDGHFSFYPTSQNWMSS